MKKAATTKKRKDSSKKKIVEDSPSRLIDARIKELSDWRGDVLAQIVPSQPFNVSFRVTNPS